MLKSPKMPNKLFNNVSPNLSPLLPARLVKNVKIKKEKPSMEKTSYHQFKYLASKAMEKFLNFILTNIAKVSRQPEVMWIWV